MRQLSAGATSAMRVGIALSGACNLVLATVNAGALNTALPAWPWVLLACQVGNGVIVAGLSFACVWMMGGEQ